jgi:large subunit ribosomal protein L30
MSKKKTINKATKKSEKQIKVTQIASPIGRKKDQELTLIGLGLNKLHRSKILEDNVCIRGMINKVQHLVKFEEI